MRYPGAAGLASGFTAGVVVVTALGEHWWEGDVLRTIGSIPAPIATIVTGVLGAAILAWQARAALKNIIAGQNHRAEIEAEARADQARLDRQAVIDDRDHEKRTLAAALHGELMSLMDSVRNNGILMGAQTVVWDSMSKDSTTRNMDFEFAFPVYSVPVYEANIAKLGLLGASVSGDVVRVFSKATVAPNPHTPLPKIKPSVALATAQAIRSGGLTCQADILHVSKRLAAILGAGPDPGYLGARPKQPWELEKPST